MNRRKFLAGLASTLLVVVPTNSVVSSLKWKFSHYKSTFIHGVFFTRGHQCLAIYKDRHGRALTYWTDMRRQSLPFAIGFPYAGKWLIQKSIWKSAS
jgi:hypothetical protein